MSIEVDEYYNGQALQDKYVLNMLKFKRNGFFLELGSNKPKDINNSYLLEKNYGWKGIMVEYDQNFENIYKRERPNSFYAMADATLIDYKDALEQVNFPKNMDYLQIDLEPGNGSTLAALNNLNNNVFNDYKFATVTFEHDIYNVSNEKNKAEIFHKTRQESRHIFESRGYVCVFHDVNNDGWWDIEHNRQRIQSGQPSTPLTQSYKTSQYPFEDWYVHPDLVDMSYVQSVIENNKSNYLPNSVCGSIINFHTIRY
jgi:hypothetical protein